MQKINEGAASSGNFVYAKSMKKKSTHHFVPRLLQTERYFTRPLASLLVRRLVRSEVHPNQVTWVAFLVGMLAFPLFAWGNRWSVIAAGLLTQLSSIIDCADGMLARYKNLSSRYGAFLDLTLDLLINFFLILGVYWGYWQRPHAPLPWWLGVAIIGLYPLMIALYYLFLLKIRSDAVGDTAELRGLMLTAIMVFSFFNRLDLILAMMGLVVAIGIPLQLVRLLRPLPEKTDGQPDSKPAE